MLHEYTREEVCFVCRQIHACFHVFICSCVCSCVCFPPSSVWCVQFSIRERLLEPGGRRGEEREKNIYIYIYECGVCVERAYLANSGVHSDKARFLSEGGVHK